MAKKLQKKNYKKVLAYDLGGTKIAVAVVNERGRILTQMRENVDTANGYKSLVEQMARLGRPFIAQHKLKSAAIASAGPLDPKAGTLLNPTNLKTNGQTWGVVPLVRELQKKIKIPVLLENDAAAAALAESWVGAARTKKNIVVITLGTGVGVGVIANGALVRSGRGLHTEAGHLILSYDDREWLCGCGNYGCAEAMLSGKNFTKKMAERWGRPQLTSEELLQLARSGDLKAKAEFRAYGERLAAFVTSLIVLFSPEKIVLSGGFSHGAEHFLSMCQVKLETLLCTRRQGHDLLPEIVLSPFQDEAGLLGAAFVALSATKL